MFSTPGFHFSPGDVTSLKLGSYLLYAWALDSNEPGHFMGLVDGMILCDKHMKSNECNVKPLSEKNISYMFYGRKTSAIFVWKIHK
jgi:hypothetical protein